MLQDLTNDPGTRHRAEAPKTFTKNELMKEASLAGMVAMQKRRQSTFNFANAQQESPQNTEELAEKEEALQKALSEIEELKLKNSRLHSSQCTTFNREQELRMKLAEQKELVQVKNKELKSMKQTYDVLANKVVELEVDLAKKEKELIASNNSVTVLNSTISELMEETEKREMENEQVVREKTEEMELKENQNMKLLIDAEKENIALKKRIDELELELSLATKGSMLCSSQPSTISDPETPSSASSSTSNSSKSNSSLMEASPTKVLPLKSPLKQNQAALSRAAALLKVAGRRSPSSPKETVSPAPQVTKEETHPTKVTEEVEEEEEEEEERDSVIENQPQVDLSNLVATPPTGFDDNEEDGFVCAEAKAFEASSSKGGRRRSVRIQNKLAEPLFEPEKDEPEVHVVTKPAKAESKKKPKKKPALSLQEVLALTALSPHKEEDQEEDHDNESKSKSPKLGECSPRELGILKSIEEVMTNEVEPTVESTVIEEEKEVGVSTRKNRRRRSGVYGKNSMGTEPNVSTRKSKHITNVVSEDNSCESDWVGSGGLLHWGNGPPNNGSYDEMDAFPEETFHLDVSLDDDDEVVESVVAKEEVAPKSSITSIAPLFSVEEGDGGDVVKESIAKLTVEPGAEVVTTQAVLALAMGLGSEEPSRRLNKLFKAAVNVELKVLKMEKYDASYRQQKKGGGESDAKKKVSFAVHDLSAVCPPIDTHKNSELPTETVVAALVGFFEARDEAMLDKGDSSVMESFATTLDEIAVEFESQSTNGPLFQLISPSCPELRPTHLAETARILVSEFSLESNYRKLKEKFKILASSALRFHLRRNLNAPPPPATTPSSFQAIGECFATDGCRSKAHLLFRLETPAAFLPEDAMSAESPFDGAAASLIDRAVASVNYLIEKNYPSNFVTGVISGINSGNVESLEQGMDILEGVRARRFLADLLSCSGLDRAVEMNGGWGKIEHFANLLARFDKAESTHFSLLESIADLQEIVANPFPGEMTSAQEKKLNTAINGMKKKYMIDPNAKKRGGRKPPKMTPEFLKVLEENPFVFPEVIENEEV